MTTILASWPLGVMVTDSSVSDGDRVWSGKKVTRWKDELIGTAGEVDASALFLDWYKNGKTGKPPKMTACQVLVLSPTKLSVYSNSTTEEIMSGGIEAIGTGAKAAMAAFEALGWTDPQRAVAIVCNHDAHSRTPVRTYKVRKLP